MEMAHEEIQEERTKDQVEEITEEKFLKDLYLFMKKRDTPIERIPHLGFKQSTYEYYISDHILIQFTCFMHQNAAVLYCLNKYNLTA